MFEDLKEQNFYWLVEQVKEKYPFGCEGVACRDCPFNNKNQIYPETMCMIMRFLT